MAYLKERRATNGRNVVLEVKICIEHEVSCSVRRRKSKMVEIDRRIGYFGSLLRGANEKVFCF